MTEQPVNDVVGDLEPARLVSNSTWIIAAQALGIAVNAIVSVVAIRQLSTGAWGNYSTAMAMLALATFVADLGVSTHILREMTVDPGQRSRLVGVGLLAVAQVGVLATVLAALALLLGWNRQVSGLVLVGLPLVFINPALNILRAPFTSARVMHYPARVTVLQTLLFGAVALGGVVLVGRAVVLIVAAILAGGAATAYGFLLLRGRMGIRPERPASSTEALRVVRAALTLTAMGAVGAVYARLDILLLAQLKDPTEVARYTVPYALVQLAYVVPSLIATAFFPLLAELLRSDPDDAHASFLRLQRLFFAISVPCALILGVGGSDWLPLVFGQRYAASTEVMEVLAWTLVLTFQGYVLWYCVLATRSEKRLVPVYVSGLVANLVANLVLIPAHGALGAAIALLITDSLLMIGEALLVRRLVFDVPFVALGLRPVLGLAVALVLTQLLRDTTPMGAALVGSTAYVLVLAVTRYVVKADLEPIWGPVQHRLAARSGRGA